MKQIMLFFIVFLPASVNQTLGGDIKKVEIECVNIMNGKSVRYVVTNNKLKVYKSANRKLYFLIAVYRMPKEKAEELNKIFYEIEDSCGIENITYMDATILDGIEWLLNIHFKNHQQTIEVFNCYFKQLDDVIFLINEEINGKKLIPPTGRFYIKNKCLTY